MRPTSVQPWGRSDHPSRWAGLPQGASPRAQASSTSALTQKIYRRGLVLPRAPTRNVALLLDTWGIPGLQLIQQVSVTGPEHGSAEVLDKFPGMGLLATGQCLWDFAGCNLLMTPPSTQARPAFSCLGPSALLSTTSPLAMPLGSGWGGF